MPDDKERGSELVTTGEAASIADVSRQAVLQAERSGKLVAARKGERGEHLFERQVVVAWARTVRKRGGSAPLSSADGRRSVPSRAVQRAGEGVRSSPAGASPSDGAVPASAVEALVLQAAGSEVVEQYRAVLLEDLANRRLAAEVARERIQLDRLRIEVDRRTLERELRRAERPNNVRQVLERFSLWLAKEHGKSAEVDTVVGFARRMIEAVGDDVVADLARGAARLEESYSRTTTRWSAWLKSKNLPATDRGAHDEFVRIWTEEAARRPEPNSVEVASSPTSCTRQARKT